MLAVLLLMLVYCACSPSMYRWAMGRAGVYETAGVDRATLNQVALDVTGFLGMQREHANPDFNRLIRGFLGMQRERANIDFSRIIIMDGEQRPELNERERAHLADVRRLVFVAAMIMVVLAMIAVILAVRVPASRSKGAGLLAGTVLLMLAGLGVFIAVKVDFYNFFVAVHRRLFTNELWYMNPETDLLIRMMPTEFFISMGMVIGGIVAAAMVASVVVGCKLMMKHENRHAI